MEKLPQDDVKKGQYVLVLDSLVRRIKMNDNESVVISYFNAIGVPYKVTNVQLPMAILEFKQEGKKVRMPFDLRLGTLKKIDKSYFDDFYEVFDESKDSNSGDNPGNKGTPR